MRLLNSRPWLPSSGKVDSVIPRTLLAALIGLAPCHCAAPALHTPHTPSGSEYVRDFDGKAHGVSPGHVRLTPTICKGIDISQEYRILTAEAFIDYFRHQGFNISQTKARADLILVTVSGRDLPEPIQFRVATLSSAGEAGRHLHLALLQHGKGRWGVHRSNLAVLGPEGSYDDIVAFAARTQLACWGVLTLAGLDDTYVIAGGYAEL